MKSRSLRLVLVVSAVLPLLAASPVRARTVLQVLGIKVAAKDVDAYLEKVKSLQAVSRRLGLPAPRVWRSTVAGPDVGTIFVGIEHASLAAFAEDAAKLQADPEWQKGLKDLDKSGIRTVISNSLLEDVTP